MKGLINSTSLFKMLKNSLKLSICIVQIFFIDGCASFSGVDGEIADLCPKTHALAGDPNKHKSIFVFLDGTSNDCMPNDPKSATNVWRLYETLSKNNDPQMTAIYIEGVGSIDNPLSGLALGRGMEPRILRGYEFISRNYNPGDDVYILGFSRGAHQARSLAGLLSYAGTPTISGENEDDLLKQGNKIIELLKKKSDEEYAAKWASGSPEQAPLLSAEIKDKFKLEMQTTEVAFLGIWDTVPGSSLKDYGYCKEKKGFVKNYLSFLIPGVDKGERYKTDSYPPIRKIAHAVSLDEKRSKFRPLLVCQPIKNEYTETSIKEKWFPGAHSDVGGGYRYFDEEKSGNEYKSSDLPAISFNWMVEQLSKVYQLNPVPKKLEENAKGLAHWSYDKGSLGSSGSVCKDRQSPSKEALHESVIERQSSGAELPILIKEKEIIFKPYPTKCSDMDS